MKLFLSDSNKYKTMKANSLSIRQLEIQIRKIQEFQENQYCEIISLYQPDSNTI